MRNIFRIFLWAAIALPLIFGGPASAQPCSGNFPSGSLCANSGASSKGATAATPTAWFDRWCSSSNGAFLTRVAGSWICTTTPPGIRRQLSADTDLYVATTGDDTGTCTLVLPCRSLQRAGDIVWNSFDTQGHAVTIHVADGTYVGTGVILDGPNVGGGIITFTGNTGTPSNVLIDATGGGYGFKLSGGASLTVSGLKIQSTLGNITLTTNASLIISSYVFGVGQDIQVETGGYFESNGNFTTAGNKSAHIHATRGGRAYFRNGTGTVSGTPAFSNFFAGGSENSFIVYESFTYSGGATGLRFFFHLGLTVRLNTTYSATFFPGDVAGTLDGSATIENDFGVMQSVDETEATTGAAGSIITAGGIYAAKKVLAVGGYLGTTTNDLGNLGTIGQYLEGSSTATALTSTVSANVASLSLTAGDWEVQGTVKLNPGATTTIADVVGELNTTSATSPITLGKYTRLADMFGTTSVRNKVFPTPVARISLAATTTVYLVVTAEFGVSTLSADGLIHARRAR